MAKHAKHQKVLEKHAEDSTVVESGGDTDVAAASAAPRPSASERLRRIGRVYWSKRLLTLPATLLVVIGVLAAIPFTRYALLGMVLRQDVAITVIDSKSNKPVSKAAIVLDGHRSQTDAKGSVKLRVRVGYRDLNISKQYYQTYDSRKLVGMKRAGNVVTVKIVALGRLVPVSVKNKLTGRPIEGATVKALNAEAVTAPDGTATIVLPAEAASPEVTVAKDNYTTYRGKIVVTDQKLSSNDFSLTPEGKLYFLSNLSGKIDVVKTDLDGSNRQTVLAGTGSENSYNTVLLASRDWKYLALYAQRKSTGKPEIDLIDTATDKMSNIDEGDASFNLIGWAGDRFIYQVTRNIPAWQQGQQVLKSFDATKKVITKLAQTTATGDGNFYYKFQTFGGIYISGQKIVYALNWAQNQYSYYDALAGQQATINTINPDGTGATIVKAFSEPSQANFFSLNVNIAPYDEPGTLAVAFPYGQNNTAYYKYEQGKLTQANDITNDNFYGSYPTYLVSPSGNQLFWSVNADGQNSLKVGDSTAQNAKTVLTTSDYNPYGWFTDGYILLQKSGSELYIMPADGSAQPFKISNYYKPRVSYYGYGSGYGGL